LQRGVRCRDHGAATNATATSQLSLACQYQEDAFCKAIDANGTHHIDRKRSTLRPSCHVEGGGARCSREARAGMVDYDKDCDKEKGRVWSAMTRESLAHGRGCCAAMSQIPPWAHVVTGALRNLDSIDSHLGRLLQDAWHYEPPGSIGLDLFDASSACRGWCLFPGVALGLVSMTGTGRHRSAYSVPWGKHDLTATPCLFNPRQTWTRHLTLGGADKRAVWFVVRGRRHWSTIGQPSPSPP
jgi:hypothetical protein